MSALDRIARTMLAVLVGADQFAQTLAVAPFACLGLAKVPNPDETISGMLGRHEYCWWALLPRALVDALFWMLTFGREHRHCRHVAEKEALR